MQNIFFPLNTSFIHFITSRFEWMINPNKSFVNELSKILFENKLLLFVISIVGDTEQEHSISKVSKSIPTR